MCSPAAARSAVSGLAWNADEHAAYGWTFPPTDERYALLEDALEFLPLLWGKGAPAYKGRVIDVPEALCYPRPLQEHVPILVGGVGERRTLRLVAQYADACNIIGDVDTVMHKAAVLRAHCDGDRAGSGGGRGHPVGDDASSAGMRPNSRRSSSGSGPRARAPTGMPRR